MTLNMIWNKIQELFSKVSKWGGLISKYNRLNMMAIVVITFFLFFFLHQVTEFWGDDLAYMLTVGTNTPLNSIRDIVVSQINHYFEWGGRTVAHSILQLLLMLGKPISSIANAIAVTALGYICFFYSGKRNAMSLIIATSLLFF